MNPNKRHILFTLFAMIIFSSIQLQAKNITAYYEAPYQKYQTIRHKLKKSGFKILTTYSPAGKKYLKVIVCTNKKLIAMASKKRRGFAALQRVLVNSKTHKVRVNNPTYWLKAFLGKDYVEGSDKPIKYALSRALGRMVATHNLLPEKKLASYHFMVGMPYYMDMLKFKYKNRSKKSSRLFTLKLNNGSKLIGVKLHKSIEDFIEQTGEDNAMIFPYTVLIENNKAYALAGKYYIALSYPSLNLGTFLKMRSSPQKIKRGIKRFLR